MVGFGKSRSRTSGNPGSPSSSTSASGFGGAVDGSGAQGTKPRAEKKYFSFRNLGKSARMRKPLREHIFLTLDDANYSPTARIISLLMMTLIFVTTVSYVMESEVCVVSNCVNGFLPFHPWAHLFYWLEVIGIIVFTIEYILRLACCGTSTRQRLSFMTKPVNMVDLAAILPFWLDGLCQTPMFPAPEFDTGTGSSGAGFLRAIRLIRVFRVFREGRCECQPLL